MLFLYAIITPDCKIGPSSCLEIWPKFLFNCQSELDNYNKKYKQFIAIDSYKIFKESQNGASEPDFEGLCDAGCIDPLMSNFGEIKCFKMKEAEDAIDGYKLAFVGRQYCGTDGNTQIWCITNPASKYFNHLFVYSYASMEYIMYKQSLSQWLIDKVFNVEHFDRDEWWREIYVFELIPTLHVYDMSKFEF